MKNKISSIQNDLASNKHDKVFAALDEITKHNPELKTQLLILKARYQEIRKLEIIGAINSEDGFRYRANLNNSLLALIDQMEAQLNDQASRAVFISYSHADASTANRIKQGLIANNIDVVIDSEDLSGGKDIAAFIRESIRETGVTLSIISKKSLLSSWVAMETITSFQQEKIMNAPRFIGCYVEKDFFNRNFVEGAIVTINEELDKLLDHKRKRIDEGLSTRDLDNEFQRWNELKLNIDEIVRRLRDTLCIDVHESVIETNLPRIINAIKNG